MTKQKLVHQMKKPATDIYNLFIILMKPPRHRLITDILKLKTLFM